MMLLMLDKNMAETVVLQIPEAFCQRLAIAPSASLTIRFIVAS